MRFCFVIAGLTLLSCATAQTVPIASPIAPAKIGVIDFYGVRNVSVAKLRAALSVKEGEPLPPSKGAIEDRLMAIPGVVQAHLEAVCCEGGLPILYVGIEERGAPHFEWKEPPQGEVSLPEELSTAYAAFLEAFNSAVRSGSLGEDLRQGHALSSDPDARAIQESFIPMAKVNLAILRNVLGNSADEGQRAAAAYILGYAPVKEAVINDLQGALRDPDSGVRSVAVHALTAMAVKSRFDPDGPLKVSATWFIEMLHSLDWSDRTKALAVLQILTDTRDFAVLAQMREKAMPELVEMARWKSLLHALPAYVLVGRMADVTEAKIQESWSSGDREFAIKELRRLRKK